MPAGAAPPFEILHPRSSFGDGKFASKPQSEPEIVLPDPRTVTVLDNRAQPVTLHVDTFGWEAQDVYSRGQCGALAAALSEQFEDATIKSAIAHGAVLVHVWLEQDGQVIDATRFFEPEEELLENIAYEWGTHSVEYQEHSREELIAMLSGDDVPNAQGWPPPKQWFPRT